MIQAIGLTKRYGNVAAIQDLTFHVDRGEIVGFLGPNGAGKTTTMRILSGYIPPTSGIARVAGYDVFTQSIQARRHIGYMPESVPLYPEMSVRAYLDFMADLHRVENRKQRVDEVMELTHVEDRARQYIGALSKGYRQRVGLAQALLHRPDLLILDEPTIGLDPRQIIEVRRLVRELAGERTVLLSSHILSEVSAVCTRVLIIHKGRIVAEDSPEQLTARLQGATRLQLQVAAPTPQLAEALAAVPGVQSVEPAGDGQFEIVGSADVEVRPALAAAVVEGGWGLLELRSSRLSLEEIFLELTREEREAVAEVSAEDAGDVDLEEEAPGAAVAEDEEELELEVEAEDA